MQPLTIWTNFHPPEDAMEKLRQSIGQHKLIVAEAANKSILAGGRADPQLSQADIAFGQPDPDQIMELKNLRWIHLTTAGYTRYDRDDLKNALKSRGTILTNASSVFDEPCAEHALAMMLALARQLPQALDCQSDSHTWTTNAQREGCYLLKGQTALLVGFGAIAKRLAELLQPFAMNLTGIRRKIRGDEPIPMASIDQLDALLPTADHVVNILPASKSTTNFFTASRLMKMKPSGIFYNIGRGDTVDQFALRTALETKRIAAAYLDVTSPEPLPPNDPLWTTPNCYITPHSAGGHRNEFDRQVEHFVNNLRRYEKNEPLRDHIV
jgi:phosphoglycerate dehydrogenase-like enzyme